MLKIKEHFKYIGVDHQQHTRYISIVKTINIFGKKKWQFIFIKENASKNSINLWKILKQNMKRKNRVGHAARNHAHEG